MAAIDAGNDGAVPDVLHAVIAIPAVLAMRKADLVTALTDRDLTTVGNVQTLRARLLEAMYEAPPAGGGDDGKKQEEGDATDDEDEDEKKDVVEDGDHQWSLSSIESMTTAQVKTALKRRGLSTAGSADMLRARIVQHTQDDRLRHEVNKTKPHGNARAAALLMPSSVVAASMEWWSDKNGFFKHADQYRTAWTTDAPVEVSVASGRLQSTQRAQPGFPNFATIERLNLEMSSRGPVPRSWQQLVRSARYLTDAPYHLTDEALQHWTCLMSLHCQKEKEDGIEDPQLPADPTHPDIMGRVKEAFPHTSYSRGPSTRRGAGTAPAQQPPATKKQRPASASSTPTCLFCPRATRPHATDDCRSAAARHARKIANANFGKHK